MRTSQIIDLIDGNGGVARARTLIAAGARPRDLARAVATDALVRVREGVYATTSTDAAVLMAAQHGGEVACVSALRAWGVWVLNEPRRVHVWLGAKGRVHPHDGCRCVDHHDAGPAGFGVVSVVLALIQVSRCCSNECFFAAYESAWNKNLLSSAERAFIRRSVPTRRRWLIDRARPDAESGLESLLRLRLIMLGIFVDCQVWIMGVGRVDFVLAGRVIIEVDGRENHDGQSLRHKDLRRDAAAAALGYETLRFDYALVVHEWPTVERAILARLRGIR